jgi:hypothetical protein
MNKLILLDRLHNGRDQFELLLNRIGFTRQLTMKGVAADCPSKTCWRMCSRMSNSSRIEW